MSKQAEISLIIPVYNEEKNINELYSQVSGLNGMDKAEIIFVNDCSTDRTEEIIKLLCKKDKRVKLITFSKNYGHQIALTAGYDFANGKAVISMDGDLQHPPALIPEMIKRWEEGAEIVYTKRTNPENLSILKRITSKLFYRLLNLITDELEIIPDSADFRLMDTKVVHYIKEFREKDRFLRGIISMVGFKKAVVEYKEDKRLSGYTKYNLKKMFSFAIKGIVSFSTFPLRLAIYVGLIISILSIMYALWITYYKLVYGISSGIASVIVGVFFMAGIQLIFLGVIGRYIASIFDEVKGRPLYCVREKLGLD